jgi:arsenate reductase
MLAFRDAFRSLERRLKIFVSLPIEKLDRVALTHQVEAIGRLRNDSVEDRAS